MEKKQVNEMVSKERTVYGEKLVIENDKHMLTAYVEQDAVTLLCEHGGVAYFTMKIPREVWNSFAGISLQMANGKAGKKKGKAKVKKSSFVNKKLT